MGSKERFVGLKIGGGHCTVDIRYGFCIFILDCKAIHASYFFFLISNFIDTTCFLLLLPIYTSSHDPLGCISGVKGWACDKL